MTMLIASVFGHSLDEVNQQLDAARQQGADAIELRLDLSEGVGDEDVRKLRETVGGTLPLILTIRSTAEGGAWEGDDSDRVSRLIELAPFADFLDVELELWRRSANIRQKIGLALERVGRISQEGGIEIAEGAHKRGLILSRHDHKTRPSSLNRDFVEMVEAEPCETPKVAWRVRTVRDNFEAFELMRACPKRPIVICMGEDGTASRVLAKKFEAFGVFAPLDSGRQTAAGQLSIGEIKSIFRWDHIGEQTKVFGVIGDPVAHSLSPRVHNAAFTATGYDGVYLPFRVEASFESFKAFMVEVLARPWMDFRGFSVTIPHKEHALRLVREMEGEIDGLAGKVGAVNTIAIADDGRLSACNTDASALSQSISELTAGGPEAMRGKPVSILGAGGAARAAAAVLCEAGAVVTIFNRNPYRARMLAETWGCGWKDWEERGRTGGWLVVNCTSVGLTDEASPLPTEAIGKFAHVMDTVYRQGGTALVREARRQQVPAADGVAMFLLQAAAQFRLWTGLAPPIDAMRQATRERT